MKSKESSQHFTFEEAKSLKVGDVVEVFIAGVPYPSDLACFKWNRAQVIDTPKEGYGERQVSLKLQVFNKEGKDLGHAVGVVFNVKDIHDFKGTVRKAPLS